MKLSSLFLIPTFTLLTAHAEYTTWTNKDGKVATMELIHTTGEGDSLAGEFRMQNGSTVTVKAINLQADSAAKLQTTQTATIEKPTKKTASENTSVFDKILSGNLLKLDGKRLKSAKDFVKPKKVYIFYYTASWCGPCHKYTPTLVEFYNQNKKGNENFELVLITSDSGEDDMEQYAVEKKMPWYQLELSKVEKFEKEHPHGVTGIPSVVVCDLAGKILIKTQNLNEVKKLIE